MFLIFISGFGSQSWHPVTVMEQSITDTLYKGIKGKGRGGAVGDGRGEGGGPVPEERLISLHGVRKERRGKERERSGLGVHFILKAQSRQPSPHGDGSPQEVPLTCTARRAGGCRRPLVISKTLRFRR